MSSETQGRRVVGFYVSEMQPGDYGLHPAGGVEAWWFRTPNGLTGRLSMPLDMAVGRVEKCHHVREHDDGAITVMPQPGNSNSILVKGGEYRTSGWVAIEWHGFIDHGVWRSI